MQLTPFEERVMQVIGHAGIRQDYALLCPPKSERLI